MEREERIQGRYNEALKQEVASAIKGGMSYQAACSKYAIKAPSTVYSWVKKYGASTGGKRVKGRKRQNKESESLIKLEHEKRELELALSRMSLKVHCLEIVIEEAGKHYQEDLKKKFIQQ